MEVRNAGTAVGRVGFNPSYSLWEISGKLPESLLSPFLHLCHMFTNRTSYLTGLLGNINGKM